MKVKRSPKLWWLEIFLPLFLGAFVWLTLSYVIYGGSIRDRLASQAEKYLIEDALRAARYEAQNKNKVTIVSLTEADWDRYEQVRLGDYRDASLAVYARVLERVLAANPERTILSWFPSAHDYDEKGLVNLSEVATNRPNKARKVYLGYSAGEKKTLPVALQDAIHVLDGDDCHYDVTSYCSYSPHWVGTWIIQQIAETFWRRIPYEIPAGHLSLNLPHTLPNYLVHLPDAASIETISFADVLEHDSSDLLRDRTVFIGSALTQNVPPPYNPAVLWRTFTVHDDRSRGLAQGGTPYHVFWAQLAQMFIDRKSVRVISFAEEMALLVMFCVSLLLLLWRFPAPVALCYYVGGAISLLFVNRWLLSHHLVYVPVFDIVFAGFFCFLYPAFAMMSYEIYRRWQAEARNHALQQSDMLKSNFVSLISHNLNTPVARMQGLVDILVAKPETQAATPVLTALRREIARLQLCVRAALLGSGLEEGIKNEKVVSLKTIKDEFQESVCPLLDRLGIKVTGAFATPDDELVYLPIRLDVRAWMFSLAGLLALCGSGRLELQWALHETDEGGYQMGLLLQGDLGSLWEYWTADERALGFFERTLVHFFRQALSLYHGGVALDAATGQPTIKWAVAPA